MKRVTDRQEVINEKCELLTSLGFEVWHQDSQVAFNSLVAGSPIFDFSATACDPKSIIYTAMNDMYKKGVAEGKRQIREQFHNLMSDEE